MTIPRKDEVHDERTQPAALLAIERFFERR